MRRLVCVKQTFPLTVLDRPLATLCMVGVLAVGMCGMGRGSAYSDATKDSWFLKPHKRRT
jgi:hypothetical protein